MTNVGSGGFERLPETPPQRRPPLDRRRQSFDRLRSVVEGDLLPRLLLAHKVGPLPPRLAARAREVLPGEDFQQFLGLLMDRPSDDAVVDFVQDRMAMGHTLEAVYEDLFTPAARDLGTRWEEDACDFVEVTLVCCQMQRVVRRLGRRMASASHRDDRGTVLVTCLPDEQHTLGAILVAEILSKEGWNILLGEPFDRIPETIDAGLLAFSLSRVDLWEKARDRIGAIRRKAGPGLQVMVGGAAFLRDPQLIMRVEADGWAEDGRSVTTLASRLCPPANLERT